MMHLKPRHSPQVFLVGVCFCFIGSVTSAQTARYASVSFEKGPPQSITRACWVSGDVDPQTISRLRSETAVRSACFIECGTIANPCIRDLQELGLHELEILESQIDEDAMKLIGEMYSLRSLVISDCSRAGPISHLAALRGLTLLTLCNARVSTAFLEKLECVGTLQVLNFSNSLMENGALANIGRFNVMQSVILNGSSITNRELALLCELPELRSIEIADTAVSDEGLSSLASLPQLRRLDLSRQVSGTSNETGGRISNTGVAHLVGLANLQELNVRYTHIRLDAEAPLWKLSKIRQLDIAGCQIDNQSMRSFRALSRLRMLNIAESQRSDDGLRELSNVVALDCLNVMNTAVTAHGVAEFVRRHPTTKVIFE